MEDRRHEDELRNWLDGKFAELHQKMDKFQLDTVQRLTASEAKILEHDKAIESAGKRGWGIVLALITGIGSAVWHLAKAAVGEGVHRH